MFPGRRHLRDTTSIFNMDQTLMHLMNLGRESQMNFNVSGDYPSRYFSYASAILIYSSSAANQVGDG